jgi:hypothetical protein
VLARIEDRHDVRVREPGGQARLADETIADLPVPREALEDIHRDRAAERLVVGEVDGGHPAATEGPFDAEAPADHDSSSFSSCPCFLCPCFFRARVRGEARPLEEAAAGT